MERGLSNSGEEKGGEEEESICFGGEGGEERGEGTGELLFFWERRFLEGEVLGKGGEEEEEGREGDAAEREG